MAARRLILAMLVLLVLSTVLATLVPVDRDRLREESTSTATATAEPDRPPEGELVRRRISADGGGRKRISLAVGDQLALAVTSSKLTDQVEIPAFSGVENVDPEFPARFDLLLLEPGSFPVMLVEAERRIATIAVAAGRNEERSGQARSRGSDSSKDSPGSSSAGSTPGASSES